MPHLIVEYTGNLKDKANIPKLLEGMHQVLIDRGSAFPIGGIRSRTIQLEHYRVADGSEDDAFVHVTSKIGAGRSPEVKKEACDDF